jgi:hypothetical protein
MSAPNLSMSGIQSELLKLFQLRSEVAADPDITPAEQVDSIKAIDGQIHDYVDAELDKADSIAYNLGEFRFNAEACKAKAKKENERAALWEQRAEQLEAATLRALMLRPEGKRHIETASSVLKVAKNPPSVQIFDSSQVPKAYLRCRITLNADLYDRLMGFLMMERKGAPIFQELQEAKVSELEPMKTEIGKELKAGVAVAGAKLVTDRVRLVVE